MRIKNTLLIPKGIQKMQKNNNANNNHHKYIIVAY